MKWEMFGLHKDDIKVLFFCFFRMSEVCCSIEWAVLCADYWIDTIITKIETF